MVGTIMGRYNEIIAPSTPPRQLDPVFWEGPTGR